MSRGVPPTEIGALFAACALIQLILGSFLPRAFYIDLPLILTLYIGWYSDPVKGAVSGTLLGISQDVIQLMPIWGLNGITKTLAGFSASYLNRWILAESNWARGILIGCVAFADHLANSLMIRVVSMGSPDLLPAGLWKAVLTGLGGTLFFHFYDRFKYPTRDYSRM